MQSADALTVQAEVLRKRLCYTKAWTVGLVVEHQLFCKVSNRPCVVFRVSSRKALVGTVENHKELLSLHNIRHLRPLSSGEIHTSRIVSAGLENQNVIWLCLVVKC